MRTADGEAGLASVASLLANGIEHQWSTGDSFGMLVGVNQTHKQAPPDVNQGGDPRHEAAAFEVMGGKTTPASLIFQFVDVVFGIGAITIQLGDAERFQFQCGDQNAVFTDRLFLSAQPRYWLRYPLCPSG